MHVAFATPNFLIQETWRADVPWRFEVLSKTLPFEGGRADLPTEPGLGIEVNETAAQRYPFKQEIIHANTIRAYDGAILDW